MNHNHILTVIFIIIICTSVSDGFVEEKKYPLILKEPWDHSPITVYIDDINTPQHYSSSYYPEIENAIKYWENGGNGKLSYTPVFKIINDSNADIYVKWVENIENVNGSEKDIAGFCKNIIRDEKFVHSIIAIEVGNHRGYSWQQYGDKTMKKIAMHEFGHALGLDHSNDKNDIMYPSYIQIDNINPLLLKKTYTILVAGMAMAMLVLTYLGVVWLRYRHKRIKLEDEIFKK